MTQYTGDISPNNEKRMYADIQVEKECPECGKVVTYDFNDHYISYGELSELYFYCHDGCEHEWEIPARIVSTKITIEVE
jgi:hypothetical protein